MSENALKRYLAGELSKLLDEVGHISEFNYLLSLEVLEWMELQPNGNYHRCSWLE